jgi:hypothetical protein
MVKIYALIDPVTNEIKYIGQTHRKLETRLKEHIYDCIRRPRSSNKVKWINSLIVKNKLPSIELLEIVEENNLKYKESHWILESIKNGNMLTNSTEGGEFCTYGSKLSSDVRKHMSKKAKERSKGSNNVMWGKKHKESSKKKMSEKKKGIYDGIRNPRSREVFEYDSNDNFIRKWSYCKECANHHRISRGNLSTYAKHNTNIDNDDNTKKYKMLKNLIFKFN